MEKKRDDVKKIKKHKKKKSEKTKIELNYNPDSWT